MWNRYRVAYIGNQNTFYNYYQTVHVCIFCLLTIKYLACKKLLCLGEITHQLHSFFFIEFQELFFQKTGTTIYKISNLH